MALAMVQFSYKSETVGNLLKNPEDRSKAVKKLIEKLGGKLISYYFAFGDYDGVVIADLPDILRYWRQVWSLLQAAVQPS